MEENPEPRPEVVLIRFFGSCGRATTNNIRQACAFPHVKIRSEQNRYIHIYEYHTS